jgi:hypothetical protein
MTALLSEQRISLADLAEREGIHPSSVWRWCTEGFKGTRLESFFVGNKRFTTNEAYGRWLAAINGVPVHA